MLPQNDGGYGVRVRRGYFESCDSGRPASPSAGTSISSNLKPAAAALACSFYPLSDVFVPLQKRTYSDASFQRDKRLPHPVHTHTKTNHLTGPRELELLRFSLGTFDKYDTA